MKRQVIAAVCTAAVAAIAFAGCGSSSSSTNSASADNSTTTVESATAASSTVASAAITTDDASAAPGEAAGFTEIPIFEDADLGGFLHMNAVYFQPVPMTGGYEDISGYDIHLEADITAEENDLGFGTGDWVPYLTVKYEIVGSDGETKAEGSFMPMSANDGPHYGANVALPDADTYTLTISVEPQPDVYLIHTDAETGPGGGGHSFDDYFPNGDPLSYTYEGWDYTPQEW